MKVAVTGASGLIGGALVASLRASGHEVIRLVRRPARSADEVRWDPRAADAGFSLSGDVRSGPSGDVPSGDVPSGPSGDVPSGPSGDVPSGPSGLDGLGACVHLAGAGVMDHRWTARYKAEIRASRVLGTRALAGALTRLGSPPATLLCASAIGWYADTGGRAVDESAPAGKAFLSRVVQEWEAAAEPAADAGIRVVYLRSGLILTPAGGILARLLRPARLGLCPRFASGRQAMSWISMSDAIGAIRFLLDRTDVSGPVNLTAPAPVTNSEFTAALAGAVGRRDLPWLRVPAPVLRVALGEGAAELLTSAQVTPKRLLDAGYEFRYPTLAKALAAELAPV
jgi:uncharacterized protein (TIGR01777 family)